MSNIDGKRMASVSGGTRWGGGMWISTYDMARFGLLWLRGGKWGDRQIVSPGLREDGDDGERARSGLRLLVVAEYDRQAVARLGRPRRSKRGDRAAT